MHHALNFDVASWRVLTLKINLESSQKMFLSSLDERSIVILQIKPYRIGL
jgi:hypothetical protein